MKIAKPLLMICALSFALCGPQAYAEDVGNDTAVAQTPSPSTEAAIDPKTLGAARELVRIQYGDDTYSNNVVSKLDSWRRVILRYNPGKNEIIQKLFEKNYVPIFVAHKDELEEVVIKVYAKNFSYDELQSILGFMNSPVGQKLHKLTPELANQMNEAGHSLKGKLTKEAIQKLIAGLKENNLNVPKELAVWGEGKK